MTMLFVLGAGDPEMVMIEDILASEGLKFVHASIQGKRCHPGNVYAADPVPGATHWVECSPQGGHDEVAIDHHRSGDPGYGIKPAHFWEASSIGQVCRLLCRQPTREQLLAAVDDHCLAAAYRGECPGVDPDVLMFWRVETRAKFQGRDPQAVVDQVIAAQDTLDSAVDMNGFHDPVRDMRAKTEVTPELPEAAARMGQPFIAQLKDRDGRTKVVLQAAGPSVMADWPAFAESIGLQDLYGGDPALGFAGGYLPE